MSRTPVAELLEEIRGVRTELAELRAIVEQLPARAPRRRAVPRECAPDWVALVRPCGGRAHLFDLTAPVDRDVDHSRCGAVEMGDRIPAGDNDPICAHCVARGSMSYREAVERMRRLEGGA